MPGTVHHAGAITCVAPSYEELVAGRSGSRPTIPTACSVDITLNGVDYTSRPAYPFWYYNLSRMPLATLRPSGGVQTGGTRVNLTGIGFYDYGGTAGFQGPKCRFGANVVPATIVSTHQASCISPPSPTQGSSDVPVWLTFNGYTDKRGLGGDGALQFRYSHPPILSGLHPWGGPKAGGVLLTVRGSGFEDRRQASTNCTLDDTLYCELHKVAVGVEYTEDVRTGLACVFDGSGREPSVLVPASIGEEQDELTCLTPDEVTLRRLSKPVGAWCVHLGHMPQCGDAAYAAAGVLAVVVRVTVNGDVGNASPTSLAHMLYHESVPRLDYVEPWGGPEAGGTPVSIIGEGLLAFGSQPRCRFGSVSVPAVVGGLNGSTHAMDGSSALRVRAYVHHARANPAITIQAGRLLTCVAPPGLLSSVRLTVSLDGSRFSTSAVEWSYIDLMVTSVSPIGGPLVGGTKVQIAGWGLSSSFGGYRCAFGNASVLASASPSGALECSAPATTQPGRVLVRVSINGEVNERALSPAGDEMQFFYIDDSQVVVSSLTPARGPIRGGTAVTVRGAGFAALGPTRCQFGEDETIGGVPQIVPAWHNSTNNLTHEVNEFVCYSPPSKDFRLVPVHLMLNGQHLQRSALRFNYTHPCYGRASLDFYELEAREAVARYMALNPGYALTTEQVIEIEQNLNASNPLVTEQALRAYAEATCFEPDEAQLGEFSPWEDAEPPIVLDEAGNLAKPPDLPAGVHLDED